MRHLCAVRCLCPAAVLAAIVLPFTPAVTEPAQAQNLLSNPAFTAGNTGFSTGYTYFTGSPLPPGRYTIAASPRDHHPLQADFGDHTTGNGLMMVVNGGTLSNVFDWPVWQQVVTVSPNTPYLFSGWTTTANALDSSPSRLTVTINGQAILSNFTVPNVGAFWQQFAGTWNSGASSQADIRVFNVNTASTGNDFVLDDFNFSRVASVAVPEPGSAALLWIGAVSTVLLSIGGRARRHGSVIGSVTNSSNHMR